MIFRKTLVRTACVGAIAASVALTGCTAGGGTAEDGGIVQVYSGGSGQLTENYNPFSPTVLKLVKGGIFESLFYFNPLASLDTEPVQLLGEGYEFNDDGTVLTVTTQEGIVWNDGEEFGPDDVAFTFNTIRDNPELDRSGNTPAGEVTGDNEVTLTFDRPSFTDGPSVLSTFIVPEHVWAEKSDVVTDINENPVGTGPLMFGEFTSQSYLLTKSPEFRAADDFEPGGARLYSLSGNEAAINKFLAGELDLAGVFVPDVDKVLEPFPEYGTSPVPSNFTVINTCANAELGCAGPQTNPAVRQAIAAALDRDQINQLAYFGRASEVSPTFVDSDTNAQFIADEFSDSAYPMAAQVDEAQSILEDDGWALGTDGIYAKDGERLSMEMLVSAGYTDYIATLEIMTQQLEAAGIEIVTSEVANAENVSKRGLGDFQLGIDGMFPGSTSDPYYYYVKYFNSAGLVAIGESGDPYGNVSRFSSPVVDEALAKAASTTDTEVKAEAYAAIQAEIVPTLPYIPLLTGNGVGLYNETNWTGFPTEEDPYAEGGDNGIGLILMNLEAK